MSNICEINWEEKLKNFPKFHKQSSQFDRKKRKFIFKARKKWKEGKVLPLKWKRFDTKEIHYRLSKYSLLYYTLLMRCEKLNHTRNADLYSVQITFYWLEPSAVISVMQLSCSIDVIDYPIIILKKRRYKGWLFLNVS